MYPFERFSEDAKRALTFAQVEAERAHHPYIGTEHLLAGVLQVTDGLGVRVLAAIEVDLQAVRTRLASMPSEDPILHRQVIPTSRVKRVIELSFEEAQRMGAGEVTTGHMVVGLLLEGEGTGAQILKERGATLGDVRDLLAMLAEAVAHDSGGDAARAMDTVAARRILAAAERDAAELGSGVVESDNLLRALASDDAFTARVLKRLGIEVAAVHRVLTPPDEVRAFSEAVQQVRAEKKKALAAGDYQRAAAEHQRQKELTRQVEAQLRRWRETLG